LVPSVEFSGSRFSSISRYRFDGEPVLFLADVVGSGLTLDRLREDDQPVDVRVWAAAGHARPSRIDLAVLHLDECGDETIRFDPTKSAPHIAPMGLLNAIRPPAYAAARSGETGAAAP
jgi:hypothetical protein